MMLYLTSLFVLSVILCYDVVPNFFICIISDPTGVNHKRIRFSDKEVSIIGNYSILTTHLPT